MTPEQRDKIAEAQRDINTVEIQRSIQKLSDLLKDILLWVLIGFAFNVVMFWVLYRAITGGTQ